MNKPVLDLSHVLTCLNKVRLLRLSPRSLGVLCLSLELTLVLGFCYAQLDSGSDEKVMLMSRDEQSCLVVSYREIKSAVEAAFK